MLSDLTTSDTGTLNMSNIPTPALYDTLPGNAILTMKVQGDLPQGALIKNASFSVQLPLGIAVVTTLSSPAVQVNTVIPIGPAVGANIYPAPTFDDTSNSLHISMSSLTGFSTGSFLTIRYVDGVPHYMHMRAPSEFKITDAKFYSDIYKRQGLQNLTLVPDSITFL